MNNISSIQQYALNLLSAKTIEDKLAAPSDSLVIENSAEQFFVSDGFMPSRPLGLEINRSVKPKSSFPKSSSLEADTSRGEVFHFFANHELLALELMALCILKFGHNAPKKYLEGLVRTMTEEQSHLQSYLERMTSLGVEFGSMPVNKFFWDCLAPLPTLEQFVCAMSMTFEQANIDFAYHYEEIFRTLGDQQSAEIMKKVRLDEINHVKHGVIWSNRWKPVDQSLWDYYRKHLVFPITPMRAKGSSFDKSGRLQAGLSTDFIDQLEVFKSSKGRPPWIFVFNPDFEEFIQAKLSQLSYSRNKMTKSIVADLAPVFTFLGNESDVTLVAHCPDPMWLKELLHFGIKTGELIEDRHTLLEKFRPDSLKDLTIAKERKVQGIRYWADISNPSADFSYVSKEFVSPIRDTEDLTDHSLEAFDELYSWFMNSNSMAQKFKENEWLLKWPYSAAGRHRIRFNGADFFSNSEVRERIKTWMMRMSVLNKTAVNCLFLLQKHVPRKMDFSCQAVIVEGGDCKILGFTRQLIDKDGQYKGHYLGKLLYGANEAQAIAWNNEASGWKKRLGDAATRCGKELFARGYTGPFGIDSFSYHDKESKTIKFQALCEINPRWTMGRVALKLQEYLPKNSLSVWIHTTKSDIRHLGFSEFNEMYLWLQSEFGLKIPSQITNSEAITSKLIPTTDPLMAGVVWTFLAVFNEHSEMSRLLRTLFPKEDFGLCDL